MDAEYWQTVGQWHEADENWEAAEALRWYEEQAARMNQESNDGSEQEHFGDCGCATPSIDA